jgi:hypothetical protein
MVVAGLIGVGPATSAFHRPVDAGARKGVASVRIEPYPEGPQPPTFTLDPARYELPIGLIPGSFPDLWPAPLNQGLACDAGSNLIVAFGDGSHLSYGPCKRPAAIEQLREDVLDVMKAHLPKP